MIGGMLFGGCLIVGICVFGSGVVTVDGNLSLRG